MAKKKQSKSKKTTKTSQLRKRLSASPNFSKLKKKLPSKKPKFKLKLKLKRPPIWVLVPAGILVCLLGLLLLFIKDLPSPSKLSSESFPVSTIISDRHGQTLYEIYSDTNRTPVPLEDIPDHVKQATIAIEDQGFYSHFGFSITGITRALRNTLFSDKLQGGSTITQQLVKVALLTPERTIERKIKEAFLTVGTELIYSKDEILEMYLNHIPYGGTAWGIESAAKTYFNKSASDLELHEAALLAGLPAAPTRFSPFGVNPELSQQRQAEVLRRMVEEGFISQNQADQAQNKELEFATNTISIKAPHFSLYVKDLLVEKYGLEMVERGGLRVTTTLDLELQEAAQASLSAEIADLERHNVGNGAALVTKPNTGEILTMIGSTNYFNTENDGQVNVTLRHRQPGSSIKPLNYATAFQLKKATPATMVLDVPTCFQIVGQPSYCPKNYDNSFHGPVQMRFALGNSYNIPAVKVLALNSLESFIATSSAMGISTFQDPSNYGLSLTLGGGEVTMVDMATAFGTLANQGVKVPLQAILEVTDWQGNILETYRPDSVSQAVNEFNLDENLSEPGSQIELGDPTNLTLTRALNRAPAYLTSHILLDNNARVDAFGGSSQLIIPNQIVSVKTGTTNNLRDNWTIGYTPEYLTAVWVGNNDNTPMNPYLVSGVTGAAPIWNDIMSFVLEGKESLWPEKPDSVESYSVCTTTGLVSHPDNPCQTRNEFFWEGTQPGSFEQLRREIWVKDDTGFQPEPGDTENLKLEDHMVLSDPFTPEYCLDCALPTDEEGEPVRRVVDVTYPLVPQSTPSPN